MAAEFTQESVLRFIISNGGEVRNPDLLNHYRHFLRESEDRQQNRELFKRFVNSVATVRQEDGVSHVILRKKHRMHLEDLQKPVSVKPQACGRGAAEILPAAGIVNTAKNNNNDLTPSLEKDVPTPPSVISSNGTRPLGPADVDSRSSGSGKSVGQPRATQEAEQVYPGKQRQLREADGCEECEVKATRYLEVRSGWKPSADTCERSLKRGEDPPPTVAVAQSLMSSSSPCLLDAPVYVSAPLYGLAGLSRSNDSLLNPHRVTDASKPQNTPLPKVLTSSHHSLSTSSDVSDTGWNGGAGRDGWSSEVSGRDESDVRSFLRRNQETKLLSQLHQPLHHSTGHLDDRSSSRSASPETHRAPVIRRLNSRLRSRSRMCRSLGENLDQPFAEEKPSRQNRLQLLSSTLSMGNLVSGPSSRGHSSRDLSSPAGSTRSLGTPGHDGSFSCKHSSVPLEPREHEWFVKAASGTWTDIYALFREDPNLLYKRDFISGFTILHWIAKHGDHRVMNTLSYGVEKAGMTLDVDAKTLCGYTPLHLAAIHGHKKLIRLLVQKFKSDVRIRDSSGKRPWQYLGKDENRDILELLGASQKMINASPALQSSGEKLPMRPATGKINIKRHSSIAALFKNKSHFRVSSPSEAF